MASTISQDGAMQAITLLKTEPNIITQIKTKEHEGYNAIQLGFEKLKKVGKSQAGHFKKSKSQPSVIKEFRVEEIPEDIKVGEYVNIDSFEIGDHVHATATSKGKGWAGTIKRHNFQRGRKTHGGRSYRRPGSIGSMYPQKIFKGKRMAGQMGYDRVTVRNLTVALVDKDNSYIGVTGAVPGPRHGIVVLQGAK